MTGSASFRTLPPWWRRAVGPLAAAALLGLALWWLLGLDRVSDRSRNEDVEMFDLAVPPPPPPPPPEDTPLEKTESTPETPADRPAVQPDPLSPAAPANTTPPAGDLASLLQDPTSDTGAFAGGPRGQGGIGKGPLIGGTGAGAAQASRAYAERVRLHLQRQLQRSPALKGKSYAFNVSVRVSPSGGLAIASVTRVDPADLAGPIGGVLRAAPNMDAPPPEGMSNVITIKINQS